MHSRHSHCTNIWISNYVVFFTAVRMPLFAYVSSFFSLAPYNKSKSALCFPMLPTHPTHMRSEKYDSIWYAMRIILVHSTETILVLLQQTHSIPRFVFFRFDDKNAMIWTFHPRITMIHYHNHFYNALHKHIYRSIQFEQEHHFI